MRALILGASLIALSTASNATIPHNKARPEVVKVTNVGHPAPPDFAAMMAMFDKFFPPQPDPDPVRLVPARTAAAAMWPDGAYANIMVTMAGGVFDRVMKMKPSELMGATDGKTVAAPSPDEPSIHDAALAKDPYFDQRSAAVRQVLVEEAGKVSAVLDPRIRDGLARSMARRFDEHQLADINAFFATPSGHALAAQYMTLWADPDMMRTMVSTMPEMMKLMPGAMEKVKAAAEKFPEPNSAVKTPAAHAKP